MINSMSVEQVIEATCPVGCSGSTFFPDWLVITKKSWHYILEAI